MERRRKFARHIMDWWDGDGVAAHRDALLSHIEERLAELPWFDAEVFAIYFEEGHTLDLFAEATGISRHTLYTTIRRVRKEIQRTGRQNRETHEGDGNR